MPQAPFKRRPVVARTTVVAAAAAADRLQTGGATREFQQHQYRQPPVVQQRRQQQQQQQQQQQHNNMPPPPTRPFIGSQRPPLPSQQPHGGGGGGRGGGSMRLTQTMAMTQQTTNFSTEQDMTFATTDPSFAAADTYACVLWNSTRRIVGAALYRVSDRTLRACEFMDDSESGDFLGLRTMLAAEQPDVLIVPSNLNAAASAACAEGATTIATENGNSDFNRAERRSTPSWLVKAAPASCFRLDAAHLALAHLRVEAFPTAVRAPNGTAEERLRYLASHVNVLDGAGGTIVALGSLVRVLTAVGVLTDGSLAAAARPDAVDASVRAIVALTCEGILSVDALTMRALHIFAPEQHPSAMGVGCPKEGFSLYALLSKTQTAPGRNMLRLWLARPLIDANQLRKRLDAVAALVQDDELCSRVQSSMSRTRDIARLLTRIRRGTNGVAPADTSALSDWRELRNGCRALMRVRSAFQQRMTVTAIPNNCLLTDCEEAESLSEVAAEIDAVLDFGQGFDVADDTRKHREVIRRGVDEELDKLKDDYESLPHRLTQVARSEAMRGARCGTQSTNRRTWRVVYLPTVLGYVVRTDRPLEESLLDDVYIDYELVLEDGTGWVNRATGDESEMQNGDDDVTGGGAEAPWSYYYRCDTTRQLDEELGDVFSRIRAGEDGVMLTLASVIFEHDDKLRSIAHAAAELDCLVALASSARQFGWSRPRIVDGSGVLNLQGVWHPLLAVVAESGNYVPNDLLLGGGHGRVLVNVAPNMSGKSALASAVALTCYLAHIGSFVPAERADVALLDSIGVAKLGEVASASGAGTLGMGSSTFCTDVRRVALLCRRATRRSLLLLDEFGDGTRSGDGLGLLSALVMHLAAQPSGTPLTLVNTHFSEMFDASVLPEHTNLQLCTMAVDKPSDGGGGNDDEREEVHAANNARDVRFRFRIQPTTTPPASFGVMCARRAGLPSIVLDRAEEILKVLSAPQGACVIPPRTTAIGTAPGDDDNSAARSRSLRIVSALAQATEVLG